jgi:hypothetical protein
VRARRRRAVAVAVIALAGAAALAMIVSSRGSHASGHPAARAGVVRASSVSSVGLPSARTPSGSRARAHRAARSPGSLPQTHELPSARSSLFAALMSKLWAGVVAGSVRPALPAFFPRAAYVQLKAIAGAASDWEDRLVHDFALDVGAAHRLLGGGASKAKLLRVIVPRGYAHWVSPGVCYNAIGYYEVPNARVVYREYGATRSFGIASMISWRGEWYVVHMGAVLRSSDTGVLDEPAPGPGSSRYSGTC